MSFIPKMAASSHRSMLNLWLGSMVMISAFWGCRTSQDSATQSIANSADWQCPSQTRKTLYCEGTVPNYNNQYTAKRINLYILICAPSNGEDLQMGTKDPFTASTTPLFQSAKVEEANGATIYRSYHKNGAVSGELTVKKAATASGGRQATYTDGPSYNANFSGELSCQ